MAIITKHLVNRVHRHVLPHPENQWQAFLLKSPSLFIYLVFLVSLTFIFNVVSIVKPGILGYASNIKKEDIVSMTNQKRSIGNVSTLVENPLLTQAAINKAQSMFSENYWAHIAPSGKTPWDFIKGAGYNYTAAGENLARDFDQPDAVVNAWIASPSHRENLLNGSYREIGVGVVNGVLDGRETTLVVQMFGTPTSNIGLAKALSQPTSQTAKTPVETTNQANVSPTPSPILTSPEIVTNLAKPSEVASLKTSANKTLINSFQIIRTVSFSLLVMLVILLGGDLIFARKKHLVRNAGHSVAHLGLLILLLVAIWYTNSGLIL